MAAARKDGSAHQFASKEQWGLTAHHCKTLVMVMFAVNKPPSCKALCWASAASRALLENNSFPLKVGLRWVFVNVLMGPKVGKKWALVCKSVSKCVKNPLLTTNPFLTQLKGVEIVG